MSTGLSLIKVLCRQGARTAFRQVDPNHFIAGAARQAPSPAAPEPFDELQHPPPLALVELPPLDLSKWN
ncbi:hypothetical protein V5F72_00755 [Xanthobacter flavus]|uniref:hypothetical protein n=1 Tax=Xanthobacter flavus TaxID=281 RepID=UPI003727B516